MHSHKAENPHVLINSAEHSNHSCENLTAEQGHWEGRWLLSKKSFSKQLTATHTTHTQHTREGEETHHILCTGQRAHTTHTAHVGGGDPSYSAHGKGHTQHT